MAKVQSPGDIRCWYSEFSSPTTESAFLQDHAGVIRRESVRSLAFCGIFFLAFGLADAAQLGYGDQALVLFLARLLVTIVALICIVMIRRSCNPARIAYRAATVFTSLAMLMFLLVAYLRGDLLLHGMSMAIMLIIVYLFIPSRLVNATIVALSASIAFLALVYAVNMVSQRQLATMTMLLILANLFGAIAARRDAHSSRQQYWAHQILISQSMRDPLTGVFNRRHLNAGLLDQEIDRARVNGESLTVIMCDIDGFKAVNDTHGHQAGDTLLRDFAHLLRSMTRDGIDTVVRYGGEEFLIILPATSSTEGSAVAEHIRKNLTEASSMHGDVRIYATASFGVVSMCFLPHLPFIASHTLIARADELMYAAKRGGRNRVHVAEWDFTSFA
jgi:diguanylate cyclase (GGDEF)-like protein